MTAEQTPGQTPIARLTSMAADLQNQADLVDRDLRRAFERTKRNTEELRELEHKQKSLRCSILTFLDELEKLGDQNG